MSIVSDILKQSPILGFHYALLPGNLLTSLQNYVSDSLQEKLLDWFHLHLSLQLQNIAVRHVLSRNKQNQRLKSIKT